MMGLPLLEDQTKAWLAERGLPIPLGRAVGSVAEAGARAESLGGGAVVKALVPTGRRGKAGAVRLVPNASACRTVAKQLLGSHVSGFPVTRLYVEEHVAIAEELYLSFSLAGERPEVLASRRGGVNIEEVFAEQPEAVVRQAIDPLRGLTQWDAAEFWLQCGIAGPVVRAVSSVTAELYGAFRAADALTLEINPLVITASGEVSLVGAMMAVDEDALFRQVQWYSAASDAQAVTGGTERERKVRQANLAYPGGECQYVELDGEIGLLVGGGGAGLYIHDLIIDFGGRPANHCVTPPTGADTHKLRAVLEAIFENPRTRSLLVGFNFAQMARADLRVRTLAEVLRAKEIDTTRLPIAIRLFGPGEEEARSLAAEFPGITYLPRGTSLRAAARKIVEMTEQRCRADA